MTTRLRFRTFFASMLLSASLLSIPAHAQDEERKNRALKLYDQGNAQYNLGRWEKAIEFFEQAYETFPAPAFIFNIGQAHRQTGNCTSAVFFYRRYLALKPEAENKAEAQGFIDDQVEVCKRKDESQNKPPTGTVSPDSGDAAVASGASSEKDDPQEPQAQVSSSSGLGTATEGAKPSSAEARPEETGPNLSYEPSLIVSRLGAGVAGIGFGEAFDSPAQLTLSLAAGYPFRLSSLDLDVGVLASLTPFSYVDRDGTESSASLTSILANIGVGYSLSDRIALRGAVGLGVSILGGLSGETLFVEPGQEVTGALSSVSLRIGVGADFYLTKSLSLTAELFTNASAAPDGLRDDLDSLSASGLLVGVGYRL